jgi:CPA2 family monovalent cation:H+ antiporter-2
MFAAIFFVSVGMLIDPVLIAQYWPAVAMLTVVVIVGKVLGVSVGAFLTGNSVRTSVQAGMSLAQIGEFSFIIAGLGLTLNATGQFLYPVAVAVSAITTLTTPWLIRAAGPVANWVDRKMPRPLQTFVALYGTWLEQLRDQPREPLPSTRIRHLVRLLVLDVALLAAIAVGTAVFLDRMAAVLEHALGVDAAVARVALAVTAGLLALPLLAGIVRVAQRLGFAIAEGALPAAAEGKLDLAAAPRRALVVTLQITIVLLTGLPLLAVTQPLLGGIYGAIALGMLLVILGVAFWNGATDLQGHVRAGAQAIVEVLMTQARRGGVAVAVPAEIEHQPLDAFQKLLPGLGDPTSFELDAQSAAVGRTLGELNLRGVTGAVVLAIMRGDQGLLAPSASEPLHAADVLALAGTHEAIEAARQLLSAPRRDHGG